MCLSFKEFNIELALICGKLLTQVCHKLQCKVWTIWCFTEGREFKEYRLLAVRSLTCPCMCVYVVIWTLISSTLVCNDANRLALQMSVNPPNSFRLRWRFDGVVVKLLRWEKHCSGNSWCYRRIQNNC